MYKLGLLLLVSGALCQHQVTQQVQAPERQIRLEDIERDGLKSAAAQQSSSYQQPSAAYQQQQQAVTYQQQQASPPSAYHQQLTLPARAPAQSFYPQFQLAPSATAYQTPQLALPQQFFHPGAAAYQQQFLQPLYLQPQAHPSYNVPLMLIPYSLQQDLLLPGAPKLRAPAAAAPQQVPVDVQSQQPLSQAKFRPSPQIQYPNPYSSQTYQQKFSAGVKSTAAPSVKDNYVQQSGYNFKLQ